MLPHGLLLNNDGPQNFNPLFLILLVSSLVVNAFSQSSWQDVTTFHPYCVRLFKSCVESSPIGGVGSGDYNVAVGICGNKMAICTFSGNLNWPWSSNIGNARPAFASVDATSRLTMYRNVLSDSSTIVTPIPWQNLTVFLPDCRAEFLRCVDTQGGVQYDVLVGVCGHGMSICTARQGRWPYGNDSSAFWQQPFTSERLQLYRNVHAGTLVPVRSWQNLAAFLPFCRNLMGQCVAASGGSSSDFAVGNCGNLMGICTSENILWSHTYDASAAYSEPYDARWLRYSNIINSISRWQDVTRFSSNCIDKFFECVYAIMKPTEDSVIGVCGNYMSNCTFNNVWPNANQEPQTMELNSTRLAIYRVILEYMTPGALSYHTFPLVNLELYSFSTHTFTNAGATGRFGPTLSQCRSAYSLQPWAQNSSFFNMTTQGVQEWTVPRTGNYRIFVKGAVGSGNGSLYGGKGALIEGTFLLQRGDVVCIVVGQAGVFGPSSGGGGGGGGSFVYNKSSNTLLIASGGGGGGGTPNAYGGFGSSTTIPVDGGGSGNGGYSSIGYGGNGGGFSVGYTSADRRDAAGGGGGWLGDGGTGAIIGIADYVGYGGKGRPGNFVGGYHAFSGPAVLDGNGGFGGGGGSGGWGVGGGGGGGNNYNGNTHGGGQGGGYFNAGTNQVNTPNNCDTHGSVTITAL